MLASFILIPLTFILAHKFFPEFDYLGYFKVFQWIAYPAMFLWYYCIYFYFRYDKYSSSGLKLFLIFFYPPIYFYKVIWKRQRELINQIKHEPVLNNKVYLESIEVNEDNDDSFWDTNFYNNPPLLGEMVLIAEQTLEVKLPEEYIDLLKTQNGGYTKGFTYPMSEKTSWSDDHIPLHELYGIVTDDSIDSAHNILDSFYLINEWNLPENQVVIAGEGHWWITLDYRESEIPSVQWIDTDTNEDVLIASSFDEFVKGLIL